MPEQLSTETLLKIQQELDWAEEAFTSGNVAKARVCARRAVGWLVQSFKNSSYGTQIGENFRAIVADENVPEEIRAVAIRLQGGNRAELEGGIFSDEPLKDAEILLNYFKNNLQ
ncbi:MAG TPA: hypothetical protein VEC36_03040 [Patescibacteria group bacterium]|nr:hypothetical protein [Patescibacteria group bacterium]